MISLFPTGAHFERCFEDLGRGILGWRLWGRLGWHEVRQRYRRSIIGPFWYTLSLAVHVGAIGIIWSILFGIKAENFIPHLCLGFLMWHFIVGLLNDGCATYESSARFILQSREPLSIYILITIWRNVLIFFHNFLVYIVTAVIFSISPSLNMLLALPGFLVLLLNVSWMAFLLGVVSARYRDVPPIVASILTVAFFVTPIMWKTDQLGSHAYLVEYNPFTHLIEIVRAPLLGHAPAMLSWVITAAIGVAGWVLMILFYARFRSRIAYWL